MQAVAAILLLQVNLALAVEPFRLQRLRCKRPPADAQASAKPRCRLTSCSGPRAIPFDAYRGKTVPPPSMVNSARLDSLVRDGKIYLSLHNAIDLALENNLDMVIARYNLPIAQMDMLRTAAGGSVRGVNTGVVSGTPGGAARSFGGAGAGAGGTSSGAGGAGAGASGLVQSTLGTGTVGLHLRSAASMHRPTWTTPSQLAQPESRACRYLQGQFGAGQRQLSPGVSHWRQPPGGTGTTIARHRTASTTTSTRSSSRAFAFCANSNCWRASGSDPTCAFCASPRTNQKVSDIAFRAQVIATVTQICDLYWDLVSAYDNEQVGERSVAFATETLNTSRKQLELQAIPEMDVLKAEGELAARAAGPDRGSHQS